MEQYIEVKIPLLFGKLSLSAGTFSMAGDRPQGSPWGIADGMIAATAAEHDLTLDTRNVKDFTGLGIVILNPWEH